MAFFADLAQCELNNISFFRTSEDNQVGSDDDDDFGGGVDDNLCIGDGDGSEPVEPMGMTILN